MSAQTQETQLPDSIPLSAFAPVIFDPPEKEWNIKNHPVTAVHVVALPPSAPTVNKNDWHLLLQVKDAKGDQTVQLDLVQSGHRSSKCEIWCHKGLEIGPSGLLKGVAKAGKMTVLPGYTVATLLRKMEASGLLHYEFVKSQDGKGSGKRWWINRVIQMFHKINVFPKSSECKETWRQAYEICSALEEVWGADHMPLVTSYPSRMTPGIFYKQNQFWYTADRRVDKNEQLLSQRSNEISAFLKTFNSVDSGAIEKLPS